LQLNATSTVIQAGNPFQGATIDVNDRFSTRNQFHGGQIGLRGRMARGQWSLNLLGTAGIGNMNEQVTISGNTTVTNGGVGNTTPGGILAQPTNIGTYNRNVFAFIPQATTNLTYHVTPTLSFHIGYNIIWISNVATSADQIDRQVNPSQFLGATWWDRARPRSRSTIVITGCKASTGV